MSQLQSGTVLSDNIGEFLNAQTYNLNRPKAFVNWVAFNEQLEYDGTGSGFEQVPDTNAFSGNTSVYVLDENGMESRMIRQKLKS
jgi:hypothetical protein